jgi:hypothetical protein
VTEVSLYELILDREKVTEALEDYIGWKEVLDQEIKVVYVISEGKWLVVKGFKLLVKGIIEGKDYFDVMPIGELEGEVEVTDMDRAYYEEYGEDGEGEAYLKRKNDSEYEVPEGVERWFPDSTLKQKGLEDLADLED